MLWKWLLRISNGFGPSKTDLITKIRPHFTIKLFEDEEWKWPYFLDSVIFWWWKCCFNCLKIGPTLGPEGARDWNQMRWDQVSGTHFGHIYPLFNPFWNLKKLTPPIVQYHVLVAPEVGDQSMFFQGESYHPVGTLPKATAKLKKVKWRVFFNTQVSLMIFLV